MDETAAYCVLFNVGKEDPAVSYLGRRLAFYKWSITIGNHDESDKSILIITPTLRALEIAAERFA